MSEPLTALVFPDVEQMIINQVLDVLGFEASTEKPGDDDFAENLPYVQVTRIGGARVTKAWGGRALHMEARLSLDVWAAHRVAATDAAAALSACFEQMHGTTRDGGLVLRTWEEVGFGLRPEDPNTNVVRLGATVGCRVRPA